MNRSSGGSVSESSSTPPSRSRSRARLSTSLAVYQGSRDVTAQVLSPRQFHQAGQPYGQPQAPASRAAVGLDGLRQPADGLDALHHRTG